jgi:hypothetical protein
LRKFIFTNTENTPLIIINVKSSCGCTVPKKKADCSWSKGTIEVKYDPKRNGFIKKSITVTSNASIINNELSYLRIKWEVKEVDTSSNLDKKNYY